MKDDAAASPQVAPAKVLVKPVSMILGVVSGLGIAVLLQQYSVAPLTWPLMIAMAVLGALVFGIALPTLMFRMYLKKAAKPAEVST